MALRQSINQQLRSISRSLVVVYVSACAVFLSVALISFYSGIPFRDFTRDPAAVMGAPPLVGMLSHLGVLLWCATSAICFFCTILLWQNRQGGKTKYFFLSSGLMTFMLLVDDLFMLHERIFPAVLNLYQWQTYLGHMVFFGIILICFKGLVLQTDYIFLFLSVAFLSLFILVDMAPSNQRFYHLFKDGFKFLGIVSWFAYYVRAGLQFVSFEE